MSAATIVSVTRSARNEIPKGWRKVRLGEVAEHRLGKMLDAKKNIGKLTPYLRNPNVKWFHIDISELGEMPFHDDEMEKYSICKGDVLICEGGEAGRAAVWERDDIGVKFQKAIHRVRVSEEINARFLVHNLMYDYFNGGLNDYYTGTTIKHFTGQDLNRYEIFLPPLKEQMRIVQVLDHCDELRQLRAKAAKRLEELSQSIFMQMFSDNEIVDHAPIDKLISDKDRINYGVVQPGDDLPEGVPLVRVANVVDGDFSESRMKKISPDIERNYGRSRLNGREILIACVGSVGALALADSSLEGSNIARAVARIPLDEEKVDRIYVYEYLKTPKAQNYFKSEIRVVAQPTLNIKQICETIVPLPPLDLQRAFAARVAEIDKLKALHRAHLAKLDELFASLQHRAFRGEL